MQKKEKKKKKKLYFYFCSIILFWNENTAVTKQTRDGTKTGSHDECMGSEFYNYTVCPDQALILMTYS